MKKKLFAMILSVSLILVFSMSAFACTPPLDLDIWGDMTPPSQIKYEPSDDIEEACKNGVNAWLKEHPIDLSKETETETEIETESETERESEMIESEETSIFDWTSYFPESLRDHWRFFVRR